MDLFTEKNITHIGIDRISIRVANQCQICSCINRNSKRRLGLENKIKKIWKNDTQMLNLLFYKFHCRVVIT